MIARAILWIAAAVATGCGTVVPPPSAPPVAGRGEAPVVAPATAPLPAPALPRALRRLWLRQTPPFQRGIAATSGHLVSLSPERLYAFSLLDGEAVGERDACDTFEGALGPLAEEVALICDREIQIFAVPSLELSDRAPLTARAELAAFAREHLAVASDDGVVRVFARRGFTSSLELAVGSLDALALSADGRTLALARGNEVFLFDGGRPRRLTQTSIPAEALVFSPDGARLFVAAPGGGLFRVSGERLASLSSLGNVQRASWPAEALLVAAGSAGLLLVEPESAAVVSVPGGLAGSSIVALSTSPDGGTSCLSDRDGRIACHAEGQAPVDVVAEPAARDERRTAGHVRRHEARELIVEAEVRAALPPEGSAIKLLRYDTSAGRTRWREVARGRVLAQNGRELRIHLERAVESAWGTPEPLDRGAPVELAWEPPEPASKDSGLAIPSPDEDR